MGEGNRFEVEHIQAYIDAYEETSILTEGIGMEGETPKVKTVEFPKFVEAFREPPFPQLVTQLEVILPPEQEARLLAYFGLDPDRVQLGPARPDLLEVLPPVREGGKHRLRIWDFKSSQAPRHDHFIQVAYYSYILDAAIKGANLDGVEVDLSHAVIRSREKEPLEFELRPYRLAVDDFLRNRASTLFDSLAADAHYNVEDHCAMCEYGDHCRSEADAHFDLSRVPYITSESKRLLNRAGIKTHRELAAIEDESLINQLKGKSHVLNVNLAKYIAAARALEDGVPRDLGGTTLLMPRYDDVRVVLSAEQDAVTGTCFALGIKTHEGWDEEKGKPISREFVFVAEDADGEAPILLEFLKALNSVLQEVDARNREAAGQRLEDDPGLIAAQEDLRKAESALAEFKRRHPRLLKSNPGYSTLKPERDSLEEGVKQAKESVRQAQWQAGKELRKKLRRLHFYVYDSIDLTILRGLVERHVFSEDSPELLEQITHLIRIFPPSSVLKDAETFRTVPGTVVTQVLKTLVALPTPYLYDLASVSKMYRPMNQQGEEKGYVFSPRYGYGWPFSNQVAFERIHDVWEQQEFNPDPKNPQRAVSPEEVLKQIRVTVHNKLRATDSVIRRLKDDFGTRLLLQKEPFYLYQNFDPLNFRMLEALRTFSMLETSLEELDVKHLHTLPVEDRVSKFVCVSGLRYVEDSEQPDGSMWFTFDPSSKDVKFDVGERKLVVTPEAQPEVLIGDVDGKLFERGFRASHLKVTLVEYDLQNEPPRVRLRPDKPDQFREKVDLSGVCTLDQSYVDYNSHRILHVLGELHSNPERALHIHELLRGEPGTGWCAPVGPDDVESAEIRLSLDMTLADEDSTDLNRGQWQAWRGVFNEPLSLIWGPPGTGKTHTIAHILLGYARAAVQAKLSLRILVTAFTHHAIVNVLKKTAELAAEYGVGRDVLAVYKLRGSGNSADDELPEQVELVDDESLGQLLQADTPCLVVGATVWSTYKGMKKSESVIQPWFDVVLVDEASQMKLPDALIAFSSSKANSNIILAGDDQQLPPIIHGTYPEEHEYMLSSVFAFVRRQITEAAGKDPAVKERMLLQLEDNFRMNEPLTAYPRGLLYEGRFRSTRPLIRIATAPEIDIQSAELEDLLLHPERPVVLCWYTPPRSYTARNPLEAELVTALAERLSGTLLDEKTGEVYTPEKFASRALAVLSPHRAQNSAIRNALRARGFDREGRPMPLVDTVEKLQGKEREVILVSYGVADEEYAAAEAQFLLSRNRFNVAATRAERKLIVVCSDTVLDVVPTDRRILLESMMLKEFRYYCSDGHVRIPWESGEGEVILNVQWKGFGGL
jgi:hypothetical protein